MEIIILGYNNDDRTACWVGFLLLFHSPYFTLLAVIMSLLYLFSKLGVIFEDNLVKWIGNDDSKVYAKKISVQDKSLERTTCCLGEIRWEMVTESGEFEMISSPCSGANFFLK